MWDIARWNNADRTVDVVYRWGGRLAFTRLGGAAVLLFSVAGLVTWVREVDVGPALARDGRGQLRPRARRADRAAGPLDLGARSGTRARDPPLRSPRPAPRPGDLLPVPLHVRRLDRHDDGAAASADHRLARGPDRRRMSVGAAARSSRPSMAALAGSLAFKAASLFAFQLVVNLLPILELDGYHVLVDLLDAPFLRQRSMAFARNKVVRKLRRRERWTPSEIGLGLVRRARDRDVAAHDLLRALDLAVARVDRGRRAARARRSSARSCSRRSCSSSSDRCSSRSRRALVGAFRTVARQRAPRDRSRRRPAGLHERAAVLARVRFLAGLPSRRSSRSRRTSRSARSTPTRP